jgi:hypothetical protein
MYTNPGSFYIYISTRKKAIVKLFAFTSKRKEVFICSAFDTYKKKRFNYFIIIFLFY